MNANPSATDLLHPGTDVSSLPGWMKDTLQQNQTFELGHFPNCKDACPEVQRLVMSEAALAEARDIAIVNQADDDQKLANLEHQQETKKCFFARIFDFFIRS